MTKNKKIIQNFRVPNGLYIYNIFSETEKKEKIEKIKKIMNKMYATIIGDDYKFFPSVSIVFRDHSRQYKKRDYNRHYRKYFSLENNNYENVTTMLNTISDGFKEFLDSVISRFIDKFFDTKKYSKKEILNTVVYSLLGYSSSNAGLLHHVDSYDMSGPSMVINLENTYLDYIPFSELSKKMHPFRVSINEGQIIAIDSDIRAYYTHGVPMGIKYKYRYAINVRFMKYINNEKACEFANIIPTIKCNVSSQINNNITKNNIHNVTLL